MHGLGHVQTRREICKSFWAKRMDLVAASNQTRQASYVDMVGQLYVGLAGRQGGRQGLFIQGADAIPPTPFLGLIDTKFRPTLDQV